jgi:hypothetical protein
MVRKERTSQRLPFDSDAGRVGNQRSTGSNVTFNTLDVG